MPANTATVAARTVPETGEPVAGSAPAEPTTVVDVVAGTVVAGTVVGIGPPPPTIVVVVTGTVVVVTGTVVVVAGTEVVVANATTLKLVDADGATAEIDASANPV